MDHRQGPTPPAAATDGVGMVGVVLSMLILALLAVGSLALLSNGSPAGTGSKTGLGGQVDTASDVLAQSQLSSVQSQVAPAATAQGGFGSGTNIVLPGTTTGPSTVGRLVSDAPTVSEAVSPGTGSGAGGGDGSSLTLAALSHTGTCWFLWISVGAATWYGAEPEAGNSCQAPALAAAPTASSPAAGTIGWSPGSYPQV